MDIATPSVLKSLAQLHQDVGIAVLKKAMDTAEQSAALVNQMLDKVDQGKAVAQSKLPNLGNYVDVRV